MNCVNDEAPWFPSWRQGVFQLFSSIYPVPPPLLDSKALRPKPATYPRVPSSVLCIHAKIAIRHALRHGCFSGLAASATAPPYGRHPR